MDRTAAPEALLRALAETTARIDAVSRRLSEAQLTESPEPEGWSLNQILWHIRSSADVYGEHITRILGEDIPRWRHVSPRARMKKTRYDQVPFSLSFAEFRAQRASLLALLGNLGPDAWQRFALVRVDKRDRQLTLQERIWAFASHERIHCDQIEALSFAT